MAPVEMARLVLPQGLLDAYGVEEIEPKEVNLTPHLVPHAINPDLASLGHRIISPISLPAVFQNQRRGPDLVLSQTVAVYT
ncbi:MAG TPA: hypothetical protein OIL86_13900 [Eggerthellaceae bacterium]|nr:hypothetical protein [Eggerthellaceae bacterium]